ncbi:MAG: P-loop NTPase [Bacillota bacterium]|nr:P-loop NTPase [Bacillota bacterium]
MSDDGCNCGSSQCGSDSCSSGGCGGAQQSFLENTHELNSIKRVIGIVSGKGGVGKSLVTSMLAVNMRRKGYNVGILDADITGPSIPKVFGITKKAEGNEFGIYPQITHNDIKVMSVNLLLDKDDSPVIWRGPIIAGTVKQFWTDVIWGDVDYLFLDMPPGTGDVPLTIFQSIPLDGIVIVTSPQDLVSLIVKKAYNMAELMNVPVLGIVENMSYLKCPDCGTEIKLFGESKIESISEKLGIKVLGKLPIDPSLAELCDKGEIEKYNADYLDYAAQYIEEKFAERSNKNMILAVATDGLNVSEHFGKCETFTLFEIVDSEVKSKKTISTIGNQHGNLPPFLKTQGVQTAILGGIGGGAKQGLLENGIEYIAGISGNIDEVVAQYIKGTLKPGAGECSGHDHGEHSCSCGNH